MTQEVLLIGGGHAHIEVVRRWAEEPPDLASLTVVDPNPRPIYSGMVPGYIAGQYDRTSLAGMKKAGVYAVRAGPLIDINIRARLSNSSLRRFKPQRDFLSLLNLGNGEAIGTKWGITLKGERVMWLKDRIDRSFMEKYR